MKAYPFYLTLIHIMNAQAIPKHLPTYRQPNPQFTEGFVPHIMLDETQLLELYQGELEEMIAIFKYFLVTTALEFSQMKIDTTPCILDLIRRKLHKMKPNFRLVGLPYFYDKISVLEKKMENPSLIQPCFKELQRLKLEFDQYYFPILQKEIERMEAFLN